MRGFLVGTLVLVGFDVLIQPNASGQVVAGGNVLVSLLRRLLSPDVAGIPDRRDPTVNPNAAVQVGPLVAAGAAGAIKTINELYGTAPVKPGGGPNKAQ